MREERGISLDEGTIKGSKLGYVLDPWTTQKEHKPLVVSSAKGNYFFDISGKKYLDFSSQLVYSNLGHTDSRLIQAITEQGLKLEAIAPSFATEPKFELAERLSEITPGDIRKTFFSTSGSEANEGAIKIARLATGKSKIICRYIGYHGSTYGSMSLSSDYRGWAFEPGIPGVTHCLGFYCYRCPFGTSYPACDLQCAKHLEDVIRFEGGAGRVAAFISEPIIGANGVIVPPDGYWQKIREICDRQGILLIIDEVMSGFGRTGKWFAIDHWGVVPDIMTMAKGLTGGYVPLGATSMRGFVAEQFEDKLWAHGATYSGYPLGMAAGVASLKIYESDDLIRRAEQMGLHLMQSALELQERHPCVGEVRGKGLFVGLELVKNRKSKEPIHDPWIEGRRSPTGKMRVLAECLKRGVYCYPGQASVITLAPPLTISKDEIEFAMQVVDEALKEADRETFV